jgi:hypothetical protein
LESVWLLWVRFFLQTIEIVRYKILQTEVKIIIPFLSLSYMPISTCLRSNIHQNGHEILGINLKT